MKLNLTDRVSFDDQAGMRVTSDGYLVANPRVARTGIQLYRGSEIGGELKDKRVVRVYRPESEVFHKDAMHSLAFRPLTNGHPPVQVTAANWKDYAVGQSGGDVARDGDCVRVPMVFMDSVAVNAIKGGKKQLSVGYTCDIVIGAGTTPQGEAFDATQTNIFANHISLEKAARGGDRLSVGDADTLPALFVDSAALVSATALIAAGKVSKGEMADATLFLAPGYPIGKSDAISVACLERARATAKTNDEEAVFEAADALFKQLNPPTKESPTMAKTIIIDGVSVMFDNDQSAQIAERAIASRDADVKKANDALADALAKKTAKDAEDAATVTKLTTQVDTLTAENTTLKQQVKDAELTPAKLDSLVKDRSEIVGKAKVLLGDKLLVDGKTLTEIKQQVVDAKLGDRAKGWTPEQISISFDTLTADVKPGDSTAVTDARVAFSQPGFHHQQFNANDPRNAAYDRRDRALSDGWKMEPPAARQ